MRVDVAEKADESDRSQAPCDQADQSQATSLRLPSSPRCVCNEAHGDGTEEITQYQFYVPSDASICNGCTTAFAGFARPPSTRQTKDRPVPFIRFSAMSFSNCAVHAGHGRSYGRPRRDCN